MATRHKNVISYVREPTQDDSGRLAFQYFELCDWDLCTFAENMAAVKRRNPSDNEARFFLHSIVAALEHCHACGVFHFDIKPDNILTRAGVVKVADFGSAFISDDARHRRHHLQHLLQQPQQQQESPTPLSPSTTSDADADADADRDRDSWSPGPAASPPPPPQLPLPLPNPLCSGTEGYLPPEAFCATYGREAASFTYAGCRDVWSLAITIYAIRSGFMPWEDAGGYDERFIAWCEAYERDDSAALANMLTDGGRLDICVEFIELLVRMLHPSPALRLTIAEVQANPWLQKKEIEIQLKS